MTSKPVSTSTRKSLELAIRRIQDGMPKVVPVGRKLSIASVAMEAGVSNATVHNRYPDIAEAIRKLVKGSYEQQLVSNRGNLKEYRNKLTRAHKEIEQLKTDLAKSQSINLRLVKENELLKTLASK